MKSGACNLSKKKKRNLRFYDELLTSVFGSVLKKMKLRFCTTSNANFFFSLWDTRFR